MTCLAPTIRYYKIVVNGAAVSYEMTSLPNDDVCIHVNSRAFASKHFQIPRRWLWYMH